MILHLSELVELYNGKHDPEIKGITHDSRCVEQGWLFAALPGSKDNGARYIVDAIQHGAVAILAEPGASIEGAGNQVALVTNDNPRRLFAQLASKFYGAQPETLIAVTGTNGKTSVVDFVRQLWAALSFKSVSIGTLGVRGEGLERSGSLTTPDSASLHAELSDLAASGVSHLAMEASSHGLHQSRLDGVRVSAAGFTNLSHDHLDYHKNMEDYLIAKAHLFEDILLPEGSAVLNADVPEFAELKDRVSARGAKIISYGRNAEDIVLKLIEPIANGQRVEFELGGESYSVKLPLVGEFQVMNALCALGLVLSEVSLQAQDVVPLLEKLNGVPGRLELIPGHPRGAVYVDYAHTPDALEKVLVALRPHTQNRLICVMGCGGDRDANKRPLMGKVASAHADMVVVTDDNPRHEDAQKIREEIKSGATEGAVVMTVPKRGEAIISSIQEMADGDVLVIAGKGHEKGQIIGDKVEPFDDVSVATAAIEQGEGL